MFSHCSLLDISGAKAEVFCPGQQQLANTYGYVRSALRAKWAGDENKTRPWRDYDTKALTPATQLFTDAAAEHVLVVGARNVGNEYGYCLRLNGNWIGRKNDKPLPEDWPVAHFHQGSIHFCEYKQRAQLPGNILTGVPLVHKNQPINYEQVLAWSSDMAHVFAVHPKGLLGPSPEAWAILSDLWEEAKQSVSEAEQIRKINDQAKALGVVPSQHLLHSVLVQYEDQRMGLAAITGGYPAIGKQLVDLGVSQAIVLDNGGSVGWWYRNQPNTEPFLLLAGPNYRPKGTVFFRVEMNSFPQPLQHPMLLKIIN